MKRPFLVLKKDCGEAVRWISDHLKQSGLQVVQTFDLRMTSFDRSLYSCPHHRTEQCDCQMVVLLVYENGLPPACIMTHGHDGQTWFTLVDTPTQTVRSSLATAIQAAMAPHIFALGIEELANAA